MALYVGDTAIRRVYRGTTPIKRIYRGDTLLWSALGTATGLSSTRNNTSFTPAWPAVDGADSYDLRWSTNSDMSSATLVTGTTSGTAVTGLSALTTYYWQVRANEGNIEGDWSATQSVTTTGTLSGLSSTRTRTSFTPSWNAITGLAYDMRWSTNSDMTSATTVTGTTSGTAVTGLDSSTTYYWEVRSKRGSTNGEWSSTQSVTTQAPLTAPARGAAPSATGSRAQVEWVATAPDNGGSAITSYQWRWREVGAQSWRTTVTTTGRTFTRTGLSNGTQYEAQFKAVNAIDAAASWSPSGTATTTAIGVPAQGLAPAASGGNKQMRWTASAPNNGGSAITAYDWRWRAVGAVSWTSVNNGGATLTRTGLAADTRYEAQFKAKNAVGTADDWSPSGTGRTDQLPVAAAPSVSINAVAAGNEGTTVTLGATVGSGGQRDGSVVYAWSVDEGTLNDATAARPVWTRPAVSATKTVGINLRITVSGDGTTTRNGTSASRDATEVSATVRNVTVLPVAVAPSVTIDAIADGAEGTDVDLSATVTGGRYDTLTYDWTADEGTLTNSNTATPTWRRPRVNVNQDTGGLRVQVTANGTGTNARNGSTDTALSAKVDARVINMALVQVGSFTVSATWALQGHDGVGNQIHRATVTWTASANAANYTVRVNNAVAASSTTTRSATADVTAVSGTMIPISVVANPSSGFSSRTVSIQSRITSG